MRKFVKKCLSPCRATFYVDERALPQRKNVLESTSYPLPLASKTSFTALHGKPSRTPTLPCLPCCAILACIKIGSWDYNPVIQMHSWIANFILLVSFSEKKSRVGVRKGMTVRLPKIHICNLWSHQPKIIESSENSFLHAFLHAFQKWLTQEGETGNKHRPSHVHGPG